MLAPDGLDYRFDFGLIWRTLPHLPALRREERLLSSGTLQRPQVLAIQKRRLGRLLSHAFRTVPFYQSRFAALAGKYKDLEGCPIEELPPLLKDEALANLGALRSRRPRQAFPRHSSGTTGVPLHFLRDLYAQSHIHLLVRNILTERWPGLGLRFTPASKVAFVKLKKEGSNPYALRSYTFPPGMGFVEHLTIAFWDDASFMKRLIAFLKKEPLELIFAEPTLLYLYSLLLKKHGCPRYPGALKAVVTAGSQVLPAGRKEFEEFFQAPVIDQYAVSEIGAVGFETSGRPGFLCKDLSFILEILDENLKPALPGKSGLIALTSLNNYSMPFIRYVPGDLGRLSPEPEGPFLRLESLEGRVNELFALKDGGLIHPYIFLSLMDRFRLPRYRIVQESLERLSFATEGDLEAERQSQIRALLRTAMKDARLDVVFEKAAFDYSHKFRAFASKVPNPYKDLLRPPGLAG